VARNPDLVENAPYVAAAKARAEPDYAGDLARREAAANQPAPQQQAPSTPKTGSSGKSTSTAAAKAAAAAPAAIIDRSTLAQQYGFTLSLMNAYPELGKLFDQAAREQWTADRFGAAVKNTQWFQTLSDTGRKAIVMQYADPASYAKLQADTQMHVKTLAASMGVDPNDSTTVNAVAQKVIMEGWSDERTNNELGLHLNFGNGGMVGGAAGQEVQNLNSYAYSMGIKNSDDWIRQNVMNIVRGTATDQDAKNQIMTQAISAFPQYEQQIRSGMTVEALAQPYTQSMQQILEVPAGQVNLFDPTIRSAMSYRNPDGSGSAQPLWQFQNSLRQDPRWSKTQNAQDAAMGTAHKVLQDWGLYS
jgi:hypothetical protein